MLDAFIGIGIVFITSGIWIAVRNRKLRRILKIKYFHDTFCSKLRNRGLVVHPKSRVENLEHIVIESEIKIGSDLSFIIKSNSESGLQFLFYPSKAVLESRRLEFQNRVYKNNIFKHTYFSLSDLENIDPDKLANILEKDLKISETIWDLTLMSESA
jgi:hypothetical protein